MLQPPVDDFCLYKEEDYVLYGCRWTERLSCERLTGVASSIQGGNDLESVESSILTTSYLDNAG